MLVQGPIKRSALFVPLLASLLLPTLSMHSKRVQNVKHAKGPVKVNQSDFPNFGKPYELDPDGPQRIMTGFSMVGCMQDKNTNARFYYNDHTPKEDRKPMTHQVCWDFCRDKGGAQAFGLIEGRNCFCTPYFHYSTGGGGLGDCTEVCEGNSKQYCGGMKMALMFEMHACQNVAKLLTAAIEKGTSTLEKMDMISEMATETYEKMLGMATSLSDSLGQTGDPVATKLLQGAKEFAGELGNAGKDTRSQWDELDKLIAEATETPEENVKEAQAITKKLESAEAEGKANADAVQKLLESAGAQIEEEQFEDQNEEEAAAPSGEAAEPAKATELYRPVMYFVDKQFEEVPSTCGGDVIKKPMLGSVDQCATACSDLLNDCDGFTYMASKTGICFLFKKLTSVQYYTGCDASEEPEKETKFMQVNMQKQDPEGTKCFAKFNHFQGTTLKPDPSGKCEMCLKEATNADRCFER